MDVRFNLGGSGSASKVIATYDVVVDVNFYVASSRSCLGCGCRSCCLYSNREVAFEQGIIGGHALYAIRDNLGLDRLRYLYRLMLKFKGRLVNLSRL